MNIAKEVDLVVVAKSCESIYIDHPKCFLIEHIVNNANLPDYVPNAIDLDKLLLVGKTSGTTGTAKIIKHTARTFINASIISTFFYKPGQTFAAYPNINHIGMAAVMTCAPVLAGVTIYSCKSLLDLMALTQRHLFDIIGLFALQIEQWQLLENLIKEKVPGMQQHVTFGQADLITAGSSPGPTMADYFFSRNGKRIRSFYGSNETLAPNFVVDITDNQYDFTKRNLGQKIPGTDYKISDDNELLVKNPGLSDFVAQENGWYRTSDYVVETHEGLLFKGRQKVNQGFYLLDLHNKIQTCLFQYGVEIDHYILDYKNNSINIHTKHQFVIDAVNNNRDTINTVIKQFGNALELTCNMINPDDHLEIKNVPWRDPKDYL